MPDEQSAAEEEGLPFETRYGQARVALERLWSSVQTMSVDILKRELDAARKNERILTHMGDATRAATAQLLAKADRAVAETTDECLKMLWDQQVQFVRKIYGSDVIEFALKALEREHKRS